MAAVILVLRALGVGDLATAVPALRGLRRAHPNAELMLAAPGWLAPLVPLTGAVDTLLPLPGLAPAGRPPRWPPGTPARPALGVNLHGRGPRSHRTLRAAAPARLLGFGCAGFPDGPQWTFEEHEVARWCRLLHWYGIPADPADLALARPAGSTVPAGVTIVHPGAKAAARRWPPERFAATARALAGAGHRVVVTGTAAERALATRVARGAGLPPSAVLAGRTGLGELAALVATARLVLSGDTGISHLATGYGTPSVVLCGPMPPRLWGPPEDRPQHRALWPAEPSPVPALDRITTDEVQAAVAAVQRAPHAGNS